MNTRKTEVIRTPYLIQRGTIIRPLASTDTRLSRAVDLDYMGSAEFEFGALPKSFRRIESKADAWKRWIANDITDGEKPLRVYGAFSADAFGEYVKHLHALRAGKMRTKEASRFDAAEQKRFKTLLADFWWDIDNDVMFGFDKEFMNRLPYYVAASLKYMNGAE